MPDEIYPSQLSFTHCLSYFYWLIMQGLKNAALTYRDHKSSWEGLMKRGMQRNCTWENAAIQYEQVFEWACFDPPYVN